MFAVSMEGRRNFVLLSCSADEGREFLEASLLAGLLKPGNKLFLPCLGLATTHLDKFRYLGADLLLLKLQDAAEDADLEADLLQDLLAALSGGLLGLKLAGQTVTPTRLSCTDTVTWQADL